jgi:hypothetical protein
MKTTIKSFIIICTLGLVSASGVNATAKFEFKDLKQANTNQAFAELNSKIALPDAKINESIDYQQEAQLVNHLIADAAEAKVTQHVFEKSLVQAESALPGNNDDLVDFRAEAQSVTKALADREEANAIQKLVDEGKLAENR